MDVKLSRLVYLSRPSSQICYYVLAVSPLSTPNLSRAQPPVARRGRAPSSETPDHSSPARAMPSWGLGWFLTCPLLQLQYSATSLVLGSLCLHASSDRSTKEGDIEGLKTKMLLLPSFIPSLHAASSLCRRRRRGRPRWWFQISGRACGRTKTRFEPIQTAAEDEAEATTGSITWRGGGQPGLPKG